MKVYIVTSASFPYGMAAVQRVQCYANAILLGGIDCEVVCFRRTSNEFMKGLVDFPAKGKYENIPYSYMGKTPIQNSQKSIRKIIEYFDKISVVKYLNNVLHKGDVILLYCGGHVSLALKLIKVAKSKGVYILKDLCELPYGTGKNTRKAIRNRKKTLKYLFPNLDGVIAISETLAELARIYCSPECKILKVPILVDFYKYRLEDNSSEESVPYIFHSGTLQEQKDGILGVFEAFGKACRQLNMPIRFISTGNIEQSLHKQQIVDLVEKYELHDKLIFTGHLTSEELRDKLSHASVVIINKYRTEQNHYCFSTKLGEYMAAAKPVIITNVGEAMNYLTNKKNAYIVEAEDNEALTRTIVDVFLHPEISKSIGKEGRSICRENFDYRSQSNRLCSFLKSFKAP